VNPISRVDPSQPRGYPVDTHPEGSHVTPTTIITAATTAPQVRIVGIVIIEGET